MQVDNHRNAAITARLLLAAGLTIEVHVPPIADTDWLDVVNQRARS
jgi:hypothetical protein